INEISHSIHRVGPGTVRILILQNEVQISLGDLPVIVPGKNLGSARQQESPVSGRIDHSSFIIRSVGTTAGPVRYLEIFDVDCGVARNRLEDLLIAAKKILWRLTSVLRPPTGA